MSLTSSASIGDRVGGSSPANPARHFAAERADFALEIADARLFGVFADEPAQRVVGDDQLIRRQAVRLERLRQQELARDRQLLDLGVARRPR